VGEDELFKRFSLTRLDEQFHGNVEPLVYLLTREELRKTTLPEAPAGKIRPGSGLINQERFWAKTRRAMVGGHDMPVID
jgi:hypothetical protein